MKAGYAEILCACDAVPCGQHTARRAASASCASSRLPRRRSYRSADDVADHRGSTRVSALKSGLGLLQFDDRGLLWDPGPRAARASLCLRRLVS